MILEDKGIVSGILIKVFQWICQVISIKTMKLFSRFMLYLDCYLGITRQGLFQTFVKVLSFLHQCYLLWSLLELPSSLQFFKITLKQYHFVEVLISCIIALWLLGVSVRHNTESKKLEEDYHSLSFQVSLYTCAVTGGTNLTTGNASFASTSWSCFCFTPIRTTESSSCCVELSSSM